MPGVPKWGDAVSHIGGNRVRRCDHAPRSAVSASVRLIPARSHSALKLAGVIGWSWWLVTLPLWGQVVIPFLWLFLLLGGGARPRG